MKNYKHDFPIFNQKINGYPLVYLDSAATSQKPQVVIDSIKTFYEKSNANVKRGIYPLSEKASGMVENVREKVCRFIHAQSKDEIIFTRNTTEALNLLMYSMSHNIKSRDIISSTIMEHHSNFVPWQILAARTNSLFEVLDISNDYQIKTTDFKKTRVLSLTLVSNVLGTLVDVGKIIKKARKENPNIIVIVDAAQAVVHVPIDVQAIDCDFLVFSGHKMYAGMGVGVLYGKKERLEELDPFMFGGQMISEVTVEKTTFRRTPDKFEAGTMNASDIVSLGKAIEYIELIGFKKIRKQEDDLTKYALEKLQIIDGLEIVGSTTPKNRIGVISFTINGIHPHDIAQVLGDGGICIRAGHHCAMPLHKRLGISSSSRISLAVYNDKEDIDRLVDRLGFVRKIFRNDE